MRALAATHAFACGALAAGLPQCMDPDYVSLGGNFALPILAADAGGPPAPLSMSDSEPNPDAGSCELGAAAVALAANCMERRAVSCSALTNGNAAPTDRERLDVTLAELLLACGERLNVLNVQLDDGCATRFELSMPNPSALACVTSRLESGRYACAGGSSCGRGVVFQVPLSAVPPDWL